MNIKYNLELDLFDAIVTQLRVRFPEARYKQLQVMACVSLYPNYHDAIVKKGLSKNKQSAMQQIQTLYEEEFLENRTNDDGTKGKKVLRDDIAKLLQKSEYQITINVKFKN